jgi:hypothetical protein
VSNSLPTGSMLGAPAPTGGGPVSTLEPRGRCLPTSALLEAPVCTRTVETRGMCPLGCVLVLCFVPPTEVPTVGSKDVFSSVD